MSAVEINGGLYVHGVRLLTSPVGPLANWQPAAWRSALRSLADPNCSGWVFRILTWLCEKNIGGAEAFASPWQIVSHFFRIIRPLLKLAAVTTSRSACRAGLLL